MPRISYLLGQDGHGTTVHEVLLGLVAQRHGPKAETQLVEQLAHARVTSLSRHHHPGKGWRLHYDSGRVAYMSEHASGLTLEGSRVRGAGGRGGCGARGGDT